MMIFSISYMILKCVDDVIFWVDQNSNVRQFKTNGGNDGGETKAGGGW